MIKKLVFILLLLKSICGCSQDNFFWSHNPNLRCIFDNVSYVRSYDDSKTSPMGIDFKPDGSTYILVYADKYVIQYDLSPAWDISTSDWTVVILLDNSSGSYRDIKFGDNGSKMYAVDIMSRKIEEYDLPTAWDLYDFSYTDNYIYCGASFNPTSVAISEDGKEVIVCGIQSSKRAWKRFTLTTAWDFSDYLEADYYEDTSGALYSAMDINREGSVMFTAAQASNIVQKMMPKSWDIDTLINTCIDYEGTDNIRGIYINEDYNRMYLVNNSDAVIEQYDLE